MTVLERFLTYIKIETTSHKASNTCPSTSGQLILAKMLVEELLALGLKDAKVDKNGYVMATLESNTQKDIPNIGFIAHMDTAPDITTKNINPRIVKDYDGNVIILNKDLNIELSPNDFPELLLYIGQDIIVTDGTTLLGSDDKSGIAEIMTAIEYITNHSEFEHGTIKIGFTPDEEIGRGADLFDVDKFNAKYAYTLDGGQIGELEYESFNACDATLIFNGRNVHPGHAKNKMINSMDIAQELHAMLPSTQKPQFTENYEGFFHQLYIEGTVETTKTAYIIRDHDLNKFQNRKSLMSAAVDFLKNKYGTNTVELTIKDSYYNMSEKIKPVYEIVKIAEKAIIDLGIKPLIKPIRGGTDGSRLSYMGLPCPNIFIGGHNFHGKYEFVPIQSMEKSVQVIVGIVKEFVKTSV